MFLNDPYPSFSGTLPNYDPTQLNNQGFDGLITGDEARREQYHNYNVTLRRQLPASFSTDASPTSARRAAACRSTRDAFDGNQINRIPFDAVAQYGDLLFSNLSSQPQLGIPLPYPGFSGNGAAGAAALPAVHRASRFLNNFRGKTRYNSLQTTLERHFSRGLALVAAYTLSKTEDNYSSRMRPARSGDWRAAAGTSRTS